MREVGERDRTVEREKSEIKTPMPRRCTSGTTQTIGKSLRDKRKRKFPFRLGENTERTIARENVISHVATTDTQEQLQGETEAASAAWPRSREEIQMQWTTNGRNNSQGCGEREELVWFHQQKTTLLAGVLLSTYWTCRIPQATRK
jgi:hypothetical protein